MAQEFQAAVRLQRSNMGGNILFMIRPCKGFARRRSVLLAAKLLLAAKDLHLGAGFAESGAGGLQGVQRLRHQLRALAAPLLLVARRAVAVSICAGSEPAFDAVCMVRLQPMPTSTPLMLPDRSQHESLIDG